MTRVVFFGDEIEKVLELDRLTGKTIGSRSYTAIFPASHYATTEDKVRRALVTIEEELDERLKELQDAGKPLEAYRLEQRTRYDLEMLRRPVSARGSRTTRGI